MFDLAAITGVAGALKSAGETLKSLVQVHDAAVIKTKVAELQGQIFAAQSDALEAQSDQLALLQTKRELEEEVASLKAWGAEKEKYELTQLAPGVFAYSRKEGAEPIAPPHQVCAECYNRGHKSVLQQETRHPGRTDARVCHACGLEIFVSGFRTDTFRPHGRPSHR